MSVSYYLAGRFSRKDELAGYARQIEAAGDYVTSRWLTGAHDAHSERVLTSEELRAFAMEDLEDIHGSSGFILFTETPDVGYTSGGRMVEFGWALVYSQIRPENLLICGPHENVFTQLAREQYDTWADLAAAKGWKS